MSDPLLILFVCTGNTCRSPMAAALFNQLSPRPEWRAESCGVAAMDGQPASASAVTVLQLGYAIDLNGHRSRQISPGCLSDASWILTMTPAQRDLIRQHAPAQSARILTVGEMAGEPGVVIPDPFGRGLDAYEEAAASLERLIRKIFARLEEISHPD